MTSTALASWGQGWRHPGADGRRVLTVRWAAAPLEMADAVIAFGTIDGASGAVWVSAIAPLPAGSSSASARTDGGTSPGRHSTAGTLPAPPSDDPASLLAELSARRRTAPSGGSVAAVRSTGSLRHPPANGRSVGSPCIESAVRGARADQWLTPPQSFNCGAADERVRTRRR